MRILFLSRHLGRAGTTTHLLGLTSGLRKAGCIVAVAGRQNKDFQTEVGPELEKLGVQCFKVNFPTVYRSWFDNVRRLLASAFELLRIVREFQPDVIHVQWRSVSPFAQFIKIFKGIPFVTTLHLQSIPSNRIYRLLSFWGDCAIAISKDTYNDLINKFRLPAHKVRLVHNGCDSEYFRPPSSEQRRAARESFGLNESDHVIGMIARLAPTKRHDVAIRALTSLRKNGKAVHLLVAGARYSPEVTPESLKQMATELGVPDLVHVLGQCDSRAVLWASDLAILPSSTEGLPLVIVEAMLCGIVSIRTPAGGACDQIDDGVNGFLFPFDDHLALADRINQLLSDHALHQRMASAALVTGREKFSLQGMIDKTLQVYESVLSRDATLPSTRFHNMSIIDRFKM